VRDVLDLSASDNLIAPSLSMLLSVWSENEEIRDKYVTFKIEFRER
jgi:hypothetical protein